MPRIIKSIIPRIRKSLSERGLLVSIGRSVLLPIHLLQEYRRAGQRCGPQERSAFDRENGVDTDGEIDGWTHLSDLKIPSANWIYGTNYTPIEPARFHIILSTLDLNFEDFTFIDFGSGKGRALLLASEYSFRRVVGVEFSPELHRIAQLNLQQYDGRRKSGTVESFCLDFLDLEIPPEPLILFLFDPCQDTVLVELLRHVGKSLETHPRAVCVIYVAPTVSKKALLDATQWMAKWKESAEHNYCLYRSTQVDCSHPQRFLPHG